MYILHLHKLSMPAEVVEAWTLNIPARVCIISNKLPPVMQQICRYVDKTKPNHRDRLMVWDTPSRSGFNPDTAKCPVFPPQVPICSSHHFYHGSSLIIWLSLSSTIGCSQQRLRQTNSLICLSMANSKSGVIQSDMFEVVMDSSKEEEKWIVQNVKFHFHSYLQQSLHFH